MERNHCEEHDVARVGWLRAAVRGANDGIISTASLIMGVAAASGRAEVLVAGMAGLVAGALSMAAGASAASFAVGAALPMATAALVPEAGISLWVTVLSLIFLAVLGAIGAKAGGAPTARAVARVTFWGAVAMAVTALVGMVFGAVV
jgi:VIT1/CCC1 family predicted Fe2+/Mn2+ transporter